MPFLSLVSKNAVLFRFSMVRIQYLLILQEEVHWVHFFPSCNSNFGSSSSVLHNGYVFMLLYFSLTVSVFLYYCLSDAPVFQIEAL